MQDFTYNKEIKMSEKNCSECCFEERSRTCVLKVPKNSAMEILIRRKRRKRSNYSAGIN